MKMPKPWIDPLCTKTSDTEPFQIASGLTLFNTIVDKHHHISCRKESASKGHTVTKTESRVDQDIFMSIILTNSHEEL